jgi:hypothetical protein
VSRINAMLDALMASLLPLATAGTVKGIVEADADFGDVAMGGGGKFDVPLIGVAYAGDKDAGPLDTGRVRQRARAGFIVFILVTDRPGVGVTQRQVNDLIDAVIDAVAGVTPMDGETPLGAPWAYAWAGPEPLPAESAKRNLRLWALTFVCEHAFVPTTASAGADDELEGVDGTMDARPGADPASEDGETMEFVWPQEEG